jgi:hypothetical protein
VSKRAEGRGARRFETRGTRDEGQEMRDKGDERCGTRHERQEGRELREKRWEM